jgi:flagellar motility protein MotE (MotC chaperone)
MKPKHAASLIEKMDTRLAIRLFSEMKGEVVGEILSYVKTEKAAEISEGLLQKN